MISSLKARLQLLIDSNAGILYLPPVFNGSLWFLKFHVISKPSCLATLSATKQLKVMLLKAFSRISVGPARLMLISSKPAKNYGVRIRRWRYTTDNWKIKANRIKLGISKHRNIPLKFLWSFKPAKGEQKKNLIHFYKNVVKEKSLQRETFSTQVWPGSYDVLKLVFQGRTYAPFRCIHPKNTNSFTPPHRTCTTATKPITHSETRA